MTLICYLAAEAASESQPGERHTQASAAGAASSSISSRGITVRNIERRHWAQPWRKNSEQLHSPVCTFELPDAAKGWKGPRLNLSLPSFRCSAHEATSSALYLQPQSHQTCCCVCLPSCCSKSFEHSSSLRLRACYFISDTGSALHSNMLRAQPSVLG